MLNFNSLSGNPEKVCWKCSYLGKFVPVNGFYYVASDNLFCFFPYSRSFEKILSVSDALQNSKEMEPSLLRNYTQYYKGFFYHPYEITFSFLYTIFRKSLIYYQSVKINNKSEWDTIFDFTMSKAPLEFYLLFAASKGNTSMGKLLWSFTDSVYFFRLIDKLSKHELDIEKVMETLVDYSQKNENQTLMRNRVCEKMLKKKSILELVEIYIFQSDRKFIKPLLDLVILYESIIREEGSFMKTEDQETAVNLGKRIGMQIGTGGKKGELYTLRKSRKKVDFLNELSRLQLKYELVIPPALYNGGLTDENFVEFKHFCMISALNSFNAKMSERKG
jgi:hypothetical protein